MNHPAGVIIVIMSMSILTTGNPNTPQPRIISCAREAPFPPRPIRETARLSPRVIIVDMSPRVQIPRLGARVDRPALAQILRGPRTRDPVHMSI